MCFSGNETIEVTMTTIEKLMERIRSYVEETSIPKASFCEKAGLSIAVMRNFDGEWDPKASTLSKMEKAVPDWYTSPSEREQRNNNPISITE